MNKQYYDISGLTIEKETEKAVLINGSWIPKSQITVIKQSYKDCGNNDRQSKTILIPQWLAVKNNFSYQHTYDIETWKELLTGQSDNEFTVLKYTELA